MWFSRLVNRIIGEVATRRYNQGAVPWGEMRYQAPPESGYMARIGFVQDPTNPQVFLPGTYSAAVERPAQAEVDSILRNDAARRENMMDWVMSHPATYWFSDHPDGTITVAVVPDQAGKVLHEIHAAYRVDATLEGNTITIPAGGHYK